MAPALGLDEETYAWLAAHASLVVHAAGSVRTTQSYDALFADNVRSTAALAALALHADARVVLASSLAPFVCCEAPPACVEEHDVAPSTRIHGAYAATKLMAEHALAASGARACIVRLGLLTPCASTLRAHDACQLSLFLRGMAAIGAAPITRGTLACDATPIDRAAHALASLALDAHALGTFHVAARAPITLDALLDALAAAGAPLPRVPAAAFADAIARAIAARGDVGTAALGLARRSLGAEGARESDLFLASATRFDTRRASAFTPPIDPPDAALLARYARAALEGDSTR